MRDLIFAFIGAATTAIGLGALGLNRARTPNAAYSAAILGILGACTLFSAMAALYISK